MKVNKAFYALLLLNISGIIVARMSAEADPGFNIINKFGKPITILINNDYKNIKQAVVQKAITIFGKTISANSVSAIIDVNKPTLLVIYEGVLTNKIEPFRPRSGDEGTPAFFYDWTIYGPKIKHYVYHFKPNKKIYVTLHSNGALNPQTGPSRGTTGKTEAGYPLMNIVSQSDIMHFTEEY